MSFAAVLRSCAPLLCAGIFLSIGSSAGLADQRCGQLVALHKQYAGVALTSEQKAIKAQMMSWYKANCGRQRRT